MKTYTRNENIFKNVIPQKVLIVIPNSNFAKVASKAVLTRTRRP